MLFPVPQNHVDIVWSSIKDRIAEACERGGLMDENDIYRALQSRDMQLWIYANGPEILATAITEIIEHPKAKIADIRIGTGTNRQAWEGCRAGLEEWARAEGCNRMRVVARKGWKRVFTDYSHTHEVLEKDL